MRIVVPALLVVWAAACSASGGVAETSNAATDPDLSMTTNVGMPPDSVVSSVSDSSSRSLDRRPTCDEGEVTLRVRSVGPILFDEGGVSVLEVRVDDELVCERVFAASGDYDNETGVFTFDPMEVRLPRGDYVADVAEYACGLKIVCEVASSDELSAALATLDRGPACDTAISVEAGQVLDLVVEYSSVDCEIRVGDIDGGVDGPVIYADSATEGEEALAVGTVDLVDGCLVLGDGSGNETDRTTLVWQAGTSWDPAQEVVVLPDGNKISMGGGIAAGGGFHTPVQVGAFVTDETAQARITECAASEASGEVFVIQHPVEVRP